MYLHRLWFVFIVLTRPTLCARADRLPPAITREALDRKTGDTGSRSGNYIGNPIDRRFTLASLARVRMARMKRGKSEYDTLNSLIFLSTLGLAAAPSENPHQHTIC
jgi:hypothetical protein